MRREYRFNTDLNKWEMFSGYTHTWYPSISMSGMDYECGRTWLNANPVEEVKYVVYISNIEG